jgi:SWI/SNF-related matrix-associated actin-dependent regulator 1 of chromatin subfamily A
MKWTDVKESEINIIESVAQDRILDPQFSVHIISYDLLAREDMLEKMKQIPKKFKVVICDESHFLKNPMAKRTKAVKPLIKNAKRAILMSGTATPSRPLELYDQIKSLFNKSFKLRKSQYGTRYCGLKMTYFGADYSGASHLNELNTLLIKLGFLRRKKDQVMNQLPKKLRQHVYLPVFDTKTGTTSETITEDQLDAVSPDLIRRFAHSGVAKLPHVCAYIRERFLQTGNEEKFLVFAHHKKVMDGIEKELIRNKTGYIRIDGETPNQSREELANQFRTEDKCQVALLSITVAGTGLNFVPCSTVVFAELFWNPGTLQQAEDRVHRIGQVASCVNVHYLLGEGTLDDVIWPLIHRKLSVVGMTLDGNVQTLNSQRS